MNLPTILWLSCVADRRGRDEERRQRGRRGGRRRARIGSDVARRGGQPDNVLADLLRSWFGADAGQPGTVQYVELVPGELTSWQSGNNRSGEAAAFRR